MGPRDFDSHMGGLYIGTSWLRGGSDAFTLPAGYEFLETNNLKSIQTGLNLGVQDMRLLPHVGISRCLGLELSVFSFSGDQPILANSSTLAPDPAYTTALIDLRSNSFSTLKLTLPVAIEFSTNKHGGKGFYILAGITGSVRLLSWSKVKYRNDGFKYENKVWGAFNSERFDYAAIVRAGSGRLGVYGRWQLSPLFDTDSGKAIYPVSVGITINSF